MSTALLYQSRRPWLLWVAFACAAAIHLGAIVIAQGKPDKIAAPDFKPPGIEIDFTNPDRAEPFEEAVMPPSIGQIPPDEEAFPSDNPIPQPARPPKKVALMRLRASTRGTAPQSGSVKALAVYGPRPVYPYEARRQRMMGSGVVLLTVLPETGDVIEAWMAESTGSLILDKASLEAFKRWRFRPGTVVKVRVPITYTLTGVSY